MHIDQGIRNAALSLNLKSARGENLVRSEVETILFRVGGVDRVEPSPIGWKYLRKSVVVGFFTHNKSGPNGTWHTQDKLPTPEYLEWWLGTYKRRVQVWEALRKGQDRTALQEILEATHRAGSRGNLWVRLGCVIPDTGFLLQR